ncbi:MAG: CubicO group peptidase (beta-lactamase class C family) [Myxococcota bacterium]|jgi:CubicO group peptidase (beta-lactamase class C family)
MAQHEVRAGSLPASDGAWTEVGASGEAAVSGWVEPGWEPVRAAFQRNFDRHREVGAGFSVWHRGRPVAELWGGMADPVTGRRWTVDTPAVVFSATKGLVAIRLLQLTDAGVLDLDAPIADVWPEFAAAGKERITARTLLNHRSGLNALDAALELSDFADPGGRVHEALVAQRPLWAPGTGQGYCGVTYGPYAGELVYRTTGQRIGAGFQQHIAEPLGLDAWIGAPPDVAARAARILPVGPREILRHHLPSALFRRTPEGRLARQIARPGSVPRRVFGSPRMTSLGQVNDPAVMALELPWMGAVASAAALAKAYAGLIGEVDGVRLVRPEALRPLRYRQSWSTRDRVLQKPMGWSQGFLKDRRHLFSPNAASFGHAGAGGAVGWADAEAELAFAYVPNRMDWQIRSPRSVHLAHSVYACL